MVLLLWPHQRGGTPLEAIQAGRTRLDQVAVSLLGKKMETPLQSSAARSLRLTSSRSHSSGFPPACKPPVSAPEDNKGRDPTRLGYAVACTLPVGAWAYGCADDGTDMPLPLPPQPASCSDAGKVGDIVTIYRTNHAGKRSRFYPASTKGATVRNVCSKIHGRLFRKKWMASLVEVDSRPS